MRISMAQGAGALAGVVGAAVLLATGLVWVLRGEPAPQPDPGATGPPGVAQPSASPDPDAALRERLGGLANLLLGDDPLLQACADPGRPVPDPTSAGPDPDPVEAVTAQTVELRELTLDQPPAVRLLPGDEMTEQVAESFAGRGESAQIDLDTRMLVALGAIAPGTDLAALRVDAFAEQVSGYHQGEENVIGVRVGEPGRLSPLERVVLAHEVEHALSHQRVGRPGSDGEQRSRSVDARRAGSALVEGSASAAMLQYANAVLSPAEQEIVRAELAERAEQQALSQYSPYLLAELRFPYQEGIRYVCRRWLAGGWEAVADAYRDPPTTTAEILFPQREGEPPQQPAALSGPGGSWERGRTSSFGAAELEWLLAAPGGDLDAGLDRLRERVSGWDGGELAVWTREEATAVGLALVDRGGGAPPLCDTVRHWYAAAFPRAAEQPDGPQVRFDGQRQDAVLACSESQVRLGIAPTLDDAGAIAG